MGYFLLAAAGGALGSAARYGAGLLAVRLFGANFPWGTLAVNVAGGFAMGLLFALHSERRDVMAFLGVGVLGGFTTFSAFSLETVRMIQRGDLAAAGAYAAASVVLACVACAAGIAAARSFA